jgi:hypothetical protein
MTWYIAIGDDLQRDEEIKFPFFRSVDYDYTDDDLIFEEVLFESRDKAAPRHRSKGEHVDKNCRLQADMRKADRSLFKLRKDTTGKP